MLVEPSILTAVPAGTEAGRVKEGAATGGAGRLAGAFGRGEAPPAGVGVGVLLASWDAGLLLTLPSLKAWGFFDLRASLLRQDFSNQSRD
jgi:hypothetical protein